MDGPAQPTPTQLPVVIVAGVASGAGKTLVAEAVTRLLAGTRSVAAAKITVTHGERGCPHGGKGCNVCSSLGGDFQIITKDSIIEQPATDTARLKLAGARPVIWAITRDVALADAWKELQNLLEQAECAVIESNTLTEHIRPSLTLMVVDPYVSRRLWKPSAERLIADSDVLVFNDRGTDQQKEAVRAEIARLRSRGDGLITVAHPDELNSHGSFAEIISALP